MNHMSACAIYLTVAGEEDGAEDDAGEDQGLEDGVAHSRSTLYPKRVGRREQTQAHTQQPPPDTRRLLLATRLQLLRGVGKQV